jgi:hypothetical protein
MRNLMWILIVLSAVAFVMAVVGALTHATILRVAPEGYSRASANLALIAIAVLLAPEHGGRRASRDLR